MARIVDEEIERLKKEVDLAELVRRSGVDLRPAGADLVGCCPFHEDRTPSLVLTPSKGLWHCMGACQAGGSVIDWLMRTEGVSFRHAVELLRVTSPGELVPRTDFHPGRSTLRRLAAPVEPDAGDDELLARVVEYYHATLASSPEVLAYLARRRIDDPEAIERFRLGFANRTLGLRLPTKNGLAGRDIRGRLERIGIYRPSGHEHLVGSLTIPVVNLGGRVTEVYGRKIGAHLKAGTPLHLYLPGPHAGIWNEEALVSSSELILAESLIDALTFDRAGFRNVTASYGTTGFTGDHRRAITAHGIEKILIAYDHDPAGDNAAASLQAELSAVGVECFRVLCPLGSDVNDVAVNASDKGEALGRLLRAAQWMGSGTKPNGTARSSASQGARSSAAEVPSVGSSASPNPAPPAPPAAAENHDELLIEMGERLWRVRHITSGAPCSSLRVNLMVRSGDRFHIDVLDLYAARPRQAFVTAAATELHADPEVLRLEIGRVLLAVEEAQDAAAVANQMPATPVMSGTERDTALALLSDPQMADRVAHAFTALGVVGELDAALATWLVLVSRLADKPLGAVIQSSSAAGKSTLAEAALSLFPEESKVAYSAMTGQALYYLGESDLAHKVLSIAETEGADRASYALKLLVSEGEALDRGRREGSTSGRLVTNTYEVTGPVALLMTTTAAELEPKLANRLVVLAVDETRPQTRAVHIAQRRSETLEGLVDRARRTETITLHHNAQRLLSPLAVVNPHATGLEFTDTATRHRRDHAKLLGLIRAVTLAHQHQRERKTVEVGRRSVTYIETAETDVALARRLADRLLPTTTDEMAPSTRRLLGTISSHVADKRDRTFTRRGLRDATGLSDTQLKVHLARLVDLEYLIANRAGPRTTYELVNDYGPDRPVGETYRPVEKGDRPVIGRFPASPEKPIATRENDGDRDLSAGIGRSGTSETAHSSARENGGVRPYRPVSGLRVLEGERNGGVVVVEGSR